MAKAKNVQRSTEVVKAPDGFNVQVDRQRGDGWLVKEIGTVVQGRLKSRFTFQGQNGKERAAYQVVLQAPCKAMTGEGDEAVEAELQVGQILNVDETAALEGLEEYTSNGGVYDIWIHYKGKRPTRNGDMWDPDIRLKTLKAGVAKAKVNNDDVPF